MVVDLAHTAAVLREPDAQHAPFPQIPPASPPLDASTISDAHLFGSDHAATAPMDPGKAPETELALALTGTMATRNPNVGYAIIGEKGKPGHMYRNGAPLGEGLSGRLYQTFADHVVLELNGHLEILKLPHQALAAFNNVVLAGPGKHVEQTPPVPAGPSLAALGLHAGDDPDHPSPAEAWFELLHPQHRIVGNQTVGIKLRPDPQLRDAYNLRPNDVLTAINGVVISGPQSFQDLQDALKSNSGSSMELTVTRDGVPQVLTVSLAD